MTITDQEILDTIEDLKGYILAKRASHELARLLLDPDPPPCSCETAIQKAKWSIQTLQELYDLRQLNRPTTK